MSQNIYKIFLPKLKPLKEYGLDLEKVLSEPETLAALAKTDESYLPWEELRHKSWIPEQFSSNKEAFWALVQTKRLLESTKTPIRDVNNNYFRMNIKKYQEFLHAIDKEMAGNFTGINHFSENNKKQFITRNLIEESIASSQIEGANTSRAVAEKMLLEGKQPHDRSEIMIVNNHRAMLRIEQGLYKEELSLALICELHSIITENTIPKSSQGKLRETFDEYGQKLKVIPWSDGTVAYITPDKEFVEVELPRLINFANDKGTEFVHPLIKAILIHFWIGLLHPFEDGNGRLARTLFYWYMLKHEYWAFKFLSLSEKIHKSHKQYAMAYIYSEQDNHDLTYFIEYNIEKLKLARCDFQDYMNKKLNEKCLINGLNQEKYGFNERQIKLLHYFTQEIDSRTNLQAYQTLYSVKKVTAISDLKGLVEKGFLIKKKQGRNTFYYPTEKIKTIFNI